MLTIVKKIVDLKGELSGFVVEGYAKDFGELQIGNQTIQRPIPLRNMLSGHFRNNQIDMRSGSIKLVGDFSISQLPTLTVDRVSQQLVPVDLSMTLVSAYMMGNDIKGFEVAFPNGAKKDMTYADVVRLSKIHKPMNFIVRTKGGKQFISGKPGVMRLSDLPVKNIDNSAEKRRRHSKTVESAKDKVGSFAEHGIDILDVYGVVAACDGWIIKMPNEAYKSTKTVVDEDASDVDFVPLGIEVAKPYPTFNTKELSAALNFQKLGTTTVDMHGMAFPFVTYVYRKKNVFYRGENHMGHIAIVVPEDKEAAVIKSIGGSLALKRIVDAKFIKPIEQTVRRKDISVLSVDTSKIDLLSKEKRAKAILSVDELAKLMREKYTCNLITKALGPRGGLIATIRGELGKDVTDSMENKKVLPMFETMSLENREAMKEAGIDLYTGEFTKKFETKAKSSKDGDSDGEKLEIEFACKTYDASKVTGKDVIKGLDSKPTKFLLPDEVVTVLRGVLDSGMGMYKKALETHAEYEKRIKELDKKLWLHNSALYLEGEKSCIYDKTRKDWKLDEKSRVKTGKVYAYAGNSKPALEAKLCVKVNGVTLGKN